LWGLRTDIRTPQIGYRDSCGFRKGDVDSLTELHKVTAEIEGLQLTGGFNPASIGTAIQSAGGGSTGRQRALLNQVQQNSSRQLLNAAQIAR